MPARMRRSRAFSAVAAGALAGALAAAGLAIPAAASGHFDPEVGGTDEINLVGISDLRVAAHVEDRGTGLPAYETDLAQPTGGGQVEVPEGTGTAALSGTLTSLNGAFGLSGSSESTSGTKVPAATVSAPVVVSSDALWTFDAVEFTVTSTITEVNVGLRGHQAEIDRCDGPVVSDYGADGKVIGEHNHCGGAYVLELEAGDVVRLTGYEAGDYVVAFLMDVPKKNTPTSVLSGADLFLQTCHFTGGQMRLVALTPQEVS